MKKIAVTISLLVFVTICLGQPINEKIKNSKGDLHLVGKINKEGLSQEPFADWFTKNQNDYTVNNVIAQNIKNELSKYRICLLYTSPSPRDKRQSRMPSSA